MIGLDHVWDVPCISHASQSTNVRVASIRIVVYVEGGLVNDVLADTPGVEAMIVDYDNEKEGDLRSERCFSPVEVNVDYINKTIEGVEE